MVGDVEMEAKVGQKKPSSQYTVLGKLIDSHPLGRANGTNEVDGK
jgi:hypothetical protein